MAKISIHVETDANEPIIRFHSGKYMIEKHS